MTVATLRMTLLWCSIINYCLLLLWWFIFTLAHSWVNRAFARFVPTVTGERLDALMLSGITFYKLIIIVFNIVPFVALCIVR